MSHRLLKNPSQMSQENSYRICDVLSQLNAHRIKVSTHYIKYKLYSLTQVWKQLGNSFINPLTTRLFPPKFTAEGGCNPLSRTIDFLTIFLMKLSMGMFLRSMNPMMLVNFLISIAWPWKSWSLPSFLAMEPLLALQSPWPSGKVGSIHFGSIIRSEYCCTSGNIPRVQYQAVLVKHCPGQLPASLVGVSSRSSVISASWKEPHLFNHVMWTLTPHPVTPVKQSLYFSTAGGIDNCREKQNQPICRNVLSWQIEKNRLSLFEPEVVSRKASYFQETYMK